MQNSKRLVQERVREIDETHRLVEAIAQELWGRYGRGKSLDWAAVDRQLGRMVEMARRNARDIQDAAVSAIIAWHPPGRRERSRWGKHPHRHRHCSCR